MSKTHVIDGKKYVEVNRNAEVGDKAVGKFTGRIYDVSEVTETGHIYDIFGFNSNRASYYVLEECCEETPDINDLLANLARRVSSLEQQLRDTQRNLETFAEQTESNTLDIAMLDSRTYSMTAADTAEGILNEIERLLKRRSDGR